MNQNTQRKPVTPEAYLALDECRAAFMAHIATHFIKILLSHEKLPNGMNRNVIKQTLDQLDRMVREVRKTAIPHNPHYLDRNLKQNKVLDLATIVDTVARIGIEDGGELYEEFVGLVIDCLDTVFYAQTHRRKLYFGKYKALFHLFTEEVKADVNGTGSQVYLSPTKELFLRTNPTDHKHEIK